MLRPTGAEQAKFTAQQNLYSTIKTIEFLEMTYMTGQIKGALYNAKFNDLYHQFSMCKNSIPDFQGVDQFFVEFGLDHCVTAKQRIRDGKSGYKGEEVSAGASARIFDITVKFIGPIDVMTMGVTAVDEILPHIRDLSAALNSYPNMPSSYQGIAKINNWVNILQ